MRAIRERIRHAAISLDPDFNIFIPIADLNLSILQILYSAPYYFAGISRPFQV
jgi:hypothetical protein